MIKKISLLISLIMLSGLGYWFIQPILQLDSLEFDAFIQNCGWYGPLVLIGLISAENTIILLSGNWLSIVTGYTYGPLLGFIYAYLGNLFGGYIIFELIRYCTAPWHKKFATFTAKLNGYTVGLIACYAIPLFPFKLVTPILGIIGLSRKRFLMSMGMGLIPNMLLLNLFGDAIGAPEYQFVLVGLMVVLLLYFIVRWFTTTTAVSQPADNLTQNQPEIDEHPHL